MPLVELMLLLLVGLLKQPKRFDSASVALLRKISLKMFYFVVFSYQAWIAEHILVFKTMTHFNLYLNTQVRIYYCMTHICLYT